MYGDAKPRDALAGATLKSRQARCAWEKIFNVVKATRAILYGACHRSTSWTKRYGMLLLIKLSLSRARSLSCAYRPSVTSLLSIKILSLPRSLPLSSFERSSVQTLPARAKALSHQTRAHARSVSLSTCPSRCPLSGGASPDRAVGRARARHTVLLRQQLLRLFLQ